MREGCPTARLIVLAAALAVASLLPTSLLASKLIPVVPAWFPEINHGPILIDGDANFTQANGVRSGSGTANRPFVISDWGISSSYYPPAIEVRNTRASFVLFNITAGDGGLYGVVVLTNVSNARLEAVSIYGVGEPILRIDASHDVTVTGSELGRWTAWGPGRGPAIVHSDRITVTNNAILSGLDLDSSTNVTVQGNTFVYGGITWHGSSPTHFSSHVITSDNLAQGKPIRYYAGCVDQVIDATGAGQVLVADCDRVHISNLTAVDPNGYVKAAIQLAYVRQANVSSNQIRYAHFGMVLDRVNDSVVFGNMVRQTPVGITLRESSGVVVFHNDLIGMDPTSYILAEDDRGSENQWSAPYPIGGNYWSLDTQPDSCSGPNQTDCTGPDGIVDAPFAIDGNTTDPYPITRPITFVDAPPVVVLTVQGPPIRAGDLVWIDTAGSYDPDGNFWPVSWEVDGPVAISPGSGTLTYFTFGSVRVYNVTLTDQDDVGVRNSTTVTINVLTPHSTPNVQFTMTIGSVPVTGALTGDTVTFDGSASSDAFGPLTASFWDFGDGQTAEGSLVVSHTYPNPGQFQVWLTVVNDRGDSAAAMANLNVFTRPVFTDYASSAGFHLPIPVDWEGQENVDVGGFTYQLVLTGPSANGHSTRIGVETDRDPTVRETSAYLDGLVQEALSSVRSDRPDAYLDGSPLHRTISGHASVTFVIRYPSDNLVQEATIVVSESHERFWLFLLTLDSSLFILGHMVIDTMATGLVITLAPIPPNVAGVPLSGLAIVVATVVGTFGAVLVIRALLMRPRRGAEGPPTSSLGSGLASVPQQEQSLVCPRCAASASPNASFCPNCGLELK